MSAYNSYAHFISLNSDYDMTYCKSVKVCFQTVGSRAYLVNRGEESQAHPGNTATGKDRQLQIIGVALVRPRIALLLIIQELGMSLLRSTVKARASLAKFSNG